MTKEENVAPLLAKRAEKCGVSAIVVHGRSADMHHKGNANFEAIKQTVEAVTIPVIGNGGIVDEETALEFFTKTGCGGLMIGRAAVENPEIFLRIEYFVKNGARMDKPSWEKKTGFLKKHAILAEQYYGEGLGLRLLRKLAPYYFKGLPHASRLRDGFNKITTMPQLDELLTEVWKSPFFEGENE